MFYLIINVGGRVVMGGRPGRDQAPNHEPRAMGHEVATRKREEVQDSAANNGLPKRGTWGY